MILQIRMKNIIQRGNIYYFRLRVPKDCQDALGKKEIVQSLRTSDWKEAKQKAKESTAEWTETFTKILNPETAAPAQIPDSEPVRSDAFDIEAYRKNLLALMNKNLPGILSGLTDEQLQEQYEGYDGDIQWLQKGTPHSFNLPELGLTTEWIPDENPGIDRRKRKVVIEVLEEMKKRVADELRVTGHDILAADKPDEQKPAAKTAEKEEEPEETDLLEVAELMLKARHHIWKTVQTVRADIRLLQEWCGGKKNIRDYSKRDLIGYRSRRYYRGTPGENDTTNHMVCVFDGGLSIQEYEVAGRDSSPQLSALTTEFVRGEGMGGGVGGMVYSIKDDGNGNDEIICSHANHRGDVIARSDEDGSLTSFALYEAYGTRPAEYEWGTDPDRQKANTKEEEKDLGLLNEGMRYRDLETGVFLTRDPAGVWDGPNVYCYVHCNPVNKFDAYGLATTGYDYLDDYNARVNIIETWEKSKTIPRAAEWVTKISDGENAKRKDHEHAFYMDHKGDVSEVEKLKYRAGGEITAYDRRTATGKKNEKATYHAHGDSKYRKASRQPSTIKNSPFQKNNDEKHAKRTDAPVVVILHNGVAVMKPDGTIEYINRSDLKPGDLSGSATKYRNYEDMANGDKSKGTPMVSEPTAPTPNPDSASSVDNTKEKDKGQETDKKQEVKKQEDEAKS